MHDRFPASKHLRLHLGGGPNGQLAFALIGFQEDKALFQPGFIPVAITHKDEVARFLRHKRTEKNIEGIEMMNKVWKAGYREGRKFPTFRRSL